MPLFDFLQRTQISPTLFFLFLLLCILPTLWAIWNIMHSRFSTPTERTLWLFLVMIFPVIGGIIYIIWGRKRACKF